MGRTRIVEAMIPVDTGADGVPSEFRLLKAGVNTYNDGDKILFDEQAADEVMKRYRARGIDLMADYEHQSLVKPPVGPAPASAKKWTPEVRGGDLMATNVAWTDKAKSMIAAGEYRYFSIACRVDTKSGRCVELLNFALTNLPAADGIAALVAASRTFNEEDNMKTVVVALGLSADTAETEAVAVASRLKDFADDVCAALKVKNMSEAIGAVRGAVAAQEQVIALKGELESIKRASTDAECKRLIDDASTDGRLPPAKRGEVEAMYSKYGIDAVKATLAMLSKVVSSATEQPRETQAATVADDEITELDVQMSRVFTGGDEEALQKRLEALREMRRNDKKVRR